MRRHVEFPCGAHWNVSWLNIGLWLYFDHDKSKFVCEKLEPHIMYVVPNFHTMWLGIDLGFAMFHAYVGGSSYLYKICLALKCFCYWFCECDESY